MKKIFFIALALLSINCKAQIIDLKEQGAYRHYPVGAYFKDIDNLLNPFVGTWLYTNGTTSLKIKLLKKVNESNGRYSEDIIVGGYEYIEDGVLKANTLPETLPSDTYKGRYFINGNLILDCIDYPRSPDCLPNEKRLYISIKDVSCSHYRNMMIRKKIVGGIEQINVEFNLNTTVYYKSTEPEPDFNFTLPSGSYTLIKQ